MYSDWLSRIGRTCVDWLGDRREACSVSSKELERIITGIRDEIDCNVDVGIVCGSGLEGLTSILDVPGSVSDQERKGALCLKDHDRLPPLYWGKAGTRRVLLFQKRFHIYDGFTPWETALPVRILSALGAGSVVLTCSSGSLRYSLQPGSILLIRDHMNWTFHNPGRGRNQGHSKRFVDLNSPYDPGLIRLTREAAQEKGIRLKEGVLASVTGPSYETRSEARMLRAMGADIVSMSMIPEVIVSKMLGLKVLGLSSVTNHVPLFGAEGKVTHGEVVSMGREIGSRLSSLIDGVIRKL